VASVADLCTRISENIERVIVGKRTPIRLCLVCVLCEGHILLEDVPGVAKTMLARSLAISLGIDFRRVQCTPDLLPTDITGTSVFNQKTLDFEFRPGPIFTNILLADEINRATPRTQSALLQAMAERHVSIDGRTHELERPHLVIATQNPVEHEGTFPLPEAQLDRFFMRLSIGYPSFQAENDMILNLRNGHPIDTIGSVATPDELLEAQRLCRQIHVDDKVREYIIKLVQGTRDANNPDFIMGASPRATQCLYFACQATAALVGRDFVIPDDVKALCGPILAHRVLLNPEARLRGLTPGEAVRRLVETVPAPVRQGL
jgi:MoxR-like ATPase